MLGSQKLNNENDDDECYNEGLIHKKNQLWEISLNPVYNYSPVCMCVCVCV